MMKKTKIILIDSIILLVSFLFADILLFTGWLQMFPLSILTIMKYLVYEMFIETIVLMIISFVLLFKEKRGKVRGDKNV